MEARHDQEVMKFGYRDLLLFLGLAVPAFLAVLVLSSMLLMVSPLRTASRPIQLVLPQLAAYAAVFAILLLMVRLRGFTLWEALRLGVLGSQWLNSIGAGIGVAFGSILLALLLRVEQKQNVMQQLMAEDPVTVAAAAVTMGPLFEEILFRGVLQPVLVASLGPVGIVAAALPFALLHGPEYGWSWQHLVIITLAGSIFGLVRYRMDSTGAAIVAHATYNSLLMLFYFLGKMVV